MNHKLIKQGNIKYCFVSSPDDRNLYVCCLFLLIDVIKVHSKYNTFFSLLVAGYVGQTGNGARLRLRQTTLLPNIPGLPMVLTLMFCPTMRVKLIDDGTKVASILCGLGYNEFTNKAYYPAHDLVLALDTELTEDEVNKVK